MAKDEAGNEIVEEKKDDVLSILEEVKAKLNEKKDDELVKSQPVATNDRRKAHMEQTKLTDDQLRLIESGQVTDQRLALMEVKANNKDYDLLAKDFEKEVEKYNKEYFRVVTPDIANEIFMAVKGRAVTAGRYEIPKSQPDRPVKKNDRDVVSSRVTRSFNGGDAGLEEDQEKQKTGAEALTDREKTYASIIGVDPADYAVEKEKKLNGVREVADKAFRIPERITTGNSADLALNDMQRRHGVRA